MAGQAAKPEDLAAGAPQHVRLDRRTKHVSRAASNGRTFARRLILTKRGERRSTVTRWTMMARSRTGGENALGYP
jgi:hypothetical protein